MLTFPGSLSAEQFLQQHWQKRALLMPGAINRPCPSLTRNELAWLATLEDVESRLVFVERDAKLTRYRAETGPFDAKTLRNLPTYDWSLLVHDVEKHVPEMRRMFAQVPFIPDWRIDDLMVSFAAPGGSVGPHTDHYDVFLCQGIGVRNWQYTDARIPSNPAASEDLALLCEFAGDDAVDTVAGDVLYLPPEVAHWGVATRACMTYSIGTRAPQISDFVEGTTNVTKNRNAFYTDTDLTLDEVMPGYISEHAGHRVRKLVDQPLPRGANEALGCCVTQTKAWLTPDNVTVAESARIVAMARTLKLHGMTRIAFDDANLYLNGCSRAISAELRPFVARLCATRSLSRVDIVELRRDSYTGEFLQWLLTGGAFNLPADL